MDTRVTAEMAELNDLLIAQCNDVYGDMEIVEAITTIIDDWQDHMMLVLAVYQLVRRTAQGRQLCEQLRRILKKKPKNNVLVLPRIQ